MDGTELKAQETAGAYRVLARKYRPQSFAELVGQEAMVRTLTNAFHSGRIAQAYMLTGVRGVGKTTTARILARALNYSVPGKVDRPTIDMEELGEHCAAIMESRHVDVIEMDAASHTGIDDIREIIEAARYKPALARYKVYIVDEVHMLSRQAFNGLLKTLEEPPPHVKFIFATTEIRKVPVTVLSRCQRFDLRRIDAGTLSRLLAEIAKKEGIAIEDGALAMIARAAEGSARDALSLTDQAIAHGAGAPITAEAVRGMLGLADHGRVIDLFEALMKGETAAALENLAAQHRDGADPVVVLEDLAAFTHLVTRLKLAAEAGNDPALTEEEVRRGTGFATALSFRILSRTWQMLLKGIEEARAAPRPLAAADMVLVRIAHAADLPTPDEALKMLRSGETAGVSGAAAPGTQASAPRAPTMRATSAVAAAPAAPQPKMDAPVTAPPESNLPRLKSLEDLILLAAARRDLPLKIALERQVRSIRFEEGRFEFEPLEGAPPGLAGELSKKLGEWTGRRWIVTIGRGATAQTIHERRSAEQAQLVTDARADPVVAAVLARFPGAEIVDVRVAGGDAPRDDAPVADAIEDDSTDD